MVVGENYEIEPRPSGRRQAVRRPRPVAESRPRSSSSPARGSSRRRHLHNSAAGCNGSGRPSIPRARRRRTRNPLPHYGPWRPYRGRRSASRAGPDVQLELHQPGNPDLASAQGDQRKAVTDVKDKDGRSSRPPAAARRVGRCRTMARRCAGTGCTPASAGGGQPDARLRRPERAWACSSRGRSRGATAIWYPRSCTRVQPVPAHRRAIVLQLAEPVSCCPAV